jgi:hypothetical protein
MSANQRNGWSGQRGRVRCSAYAEGDQNGTYRSFRSARILRVTSSISTLCGVDFDGRSGQRQATIGFSEGCTTGRSRCTGCRSRWGDSCVGPLLSHQRIARTVDLNQQSPQPGKIGFGHTRPEERLEAARATTSRVSQAACPAAGSSLEFDTIWLIRPRIAEKVTNSHTKRTAKRLQGLTSLRTHFNVLLVYLGTQGLQRDLQFPNIDENPDLLGVASWQANRGFEGIPKPCG